MNAFDGMGLVIAGYQGAMNLGNKNGNGWESKDLYTHPTTVVES